MILFFDDWKKYPNAIADVNTPNKSFLRLATVYRSMGVKNHAFILALHDRKLQGIDPHDPMISLENQLRVAAECKINPWYFYREVTKVPAIGGTEATPFEAHRGNISLYWLFYNHIMQILIQIRQTGKSYGVDTLQVNNLNIACTNTKINLLTKDDTLRRANIQRIKDITEELPFYLKQKRPDDLNNTEEITVNSLGNRYTTHVPNASPKRAINLGRGLTTAIFHIDEPPFQPNISIALPAALAAMGAAIDKAKAEDALYGTILTTTAGKKDDKDGKFVYDLMMESAMWTEALLDCKDKDDLEKVIRKNSPGGKLRVCSIFNHRQLGKDDKWLLQRLEEAVQSGDDANRDFFNLWTSGNASNPLPTAVLERITASYSEPSWINIHPVNSYIIRWFYPEDEMMYRLANGKFVAGMDTSDAIGKDDISLVIMDVETFEVVGAGTFNETNLITFAMWITELLITIPNLTLIPERRSSGMTIIDYLLLYLPEKGIDPFKRIYNNVVNEHLEDPDRFREINIPMNRRDRNVYVKYKSLFGYNTSGSGSNSRSALYSKSLNLAAKHACDGVRDKRTIDQINGLVTKNGRVDHQDGDHDDMIVGWLLCIWFLSFGANLQFYGINPSIVAKSSSSVQDLDPEVILRRHEQKVIREELERVGDALIRERDDFKAIMLEQKLKGLLNKINLDDVDGEVYNVDELIRKVKEIRANTKKLSRYNTNSIDTYSPVNRFEYSNEVILPDSYY